MIGGENGDTKVILKRESKEVKQRISGWKSELESVHIAEDLDKKFTHKSNYKMKRLMKHYASFFDEESGNSKEQGMEQVKSYLKRWNCRCYESI